VVATGTDPRASQLSMKIEADSLFVQLMGTGASLMSAFNLLLDTDNSASTGLVSSSWSAKSGADYLVDATQKLQQHSTSGLLAPSPEQRAAFVWKDGARVACEQGQDSLQFKIPLAALGITTASPHIGVGFQWMGAGGNSLVQIPSVPAFARFTVDGSEPYDTAHCREAFTRLPVPEATPKCTADPSTLPAHRAAKAPLGRGVIIPAYVPPGDASSEDPQAKADAAAWARLIASAGNYAKRGDFWVAITGPASGPPVASARVTAEVARAYAALMMPKWLELQQAGAKLFGYVHARQSASADPTQFRDLAEVEQDINDWICLIPGIDGIWIDEFDTRYEHTSDKDNLIPDFPARDAVAPDDRCYVNADNSINGRLVEPAGGYFDQLNRWVSANYGMLRLIGNAGAPLPTRFDLYAKRVDVVVPFENTHAVASADWKGFKDRLLPATPSLALFLSTDQISMPEAIQQAQNAGYSHVYATSGLYAEVASDGTVVHNGWRVIPDYLDAELDLIFPSRSLLTP
jgi:hypothetical protein